MEKKTASLIVTSSKTSLVLCVSIYIYMFGTVLQAFGQHHCPRGVVGALSSFISTPSGALSGTLSGVLRFQLCKLHCLISMQEMQNYTS